MFRFCIPKRLLGGSEDWGSERNRNFRVNNFFFVCESAAMRTVSLRGSVCVCSAHRNFGL